MQQPKNPPHYSRVSHWVTLFSLWRQLRSDRGFAPPSRTNRRKEKANSPKPGAVVNLGRWRVAMLSPSKNGSQGIDDFGDYHYSIYLYILICICILYDLIWLSLWYPMWYRYYSNLSNHLGNIAILGESRSRSLRSLEHGRSWEAVEPCRGRLEEISIQG